MHTDCRYIIASRQRECRKPAKSPFQTVVLTTVIKPIALAQWCTNARKIAEALSQSWDSTEAADDVVILMLNEDTNCWDCEVASFEIKQQPVADPEVLEPYDGVPADTGTV